MENEDEPCTRIDCWCNDSTLPQPGSIWIYSKDNIRVKIHLKKRHRGLVANVLDDKDPTHYGGYLIFTVEHEHWMNDYCLECFLNDHVKGYEDNV